MVLGLLGVDSLCYDWGNGELSKQSLLFSPGSGFKNSKGKARRNWRWEGLEEISFKVSKISESLQSDDLGGECVVVGSLI